LEWASLEEGMGEFRRAYQVAEMGLLKFHQSTSLRLRQIATLNQLAGQLDRRLDREGARSARRNVVSIARDAAFISAGTEISRRQKLQIFELGERAATSLRDDRSKRELIEARAAMIEQSGVATQRTPGGDPRLRDALIGVAPLRIFDRDLVRAKTIEIVQALEASADFVDVLRLQGLAMATISSALSHSIPGFDAQKLGYNSLVPFMQVTLNGSPYQLSRSGLTLTAEARLVVRTRLPE